MAKNEQRRQKQIAKKKAKERDKRKKMAHDRQITNSLAGQMTLSSGGEVIHCFAAESLFGDQGIGPVVISRQSKDGMIASAVFLLDRLCLGVKNTVGHYVCPATTREFVEKVQGSRSFRDLEPSIAHGIVEGAVRYARSFGFEPEKDYPKLAKIWGDIPVGSVDGVIEFGRDGKPCYVNGPFEDAATQRLILSKLEANAGPGNYHFAVGGPGEMPFDPENMSPEQIRSIAYDMIESGEFGDLDKDDLKAILDPDEDE